MSRAFVKEDDGDQSEELPARPISSLPNYVTRSGREFLEAQVLKLGERRTQLAKNRHEPDTIRKLKEVERDLRYFECRLESAILVDHCETSPEEVLFGAEVDVVDAHGVPATYWIVGEDEADAGKGRICWASPLADIFLGKKTGDRVVWQQEDGCVELTVCAVRYACRDNPK